MFNSLEKATTDTQILSEKAKEIRREYYRKWREKNKEKTKQYQKNYWLKRAAEKLKEG